MHRLHLTTISMAVLIAVTVPIAACSRDARTGVAPAPSTPTTGAARPSPDTTCTPTVPNGQAPPGEPPSVYYYGNGKLFTVLWPDGVVVFEPGGPGEIRDDGSLAMKWPFVRGEGVSGRLTVEGRSLHRPGLAVSAEIADGYGLTGFQASALVFPEPGCWEVVARVDEAALSFVTRVELRD